MTRPQDAVRQFFPENPPRDHVGNMPPLPGIFPDYQAPIVRTGAGGRELVMARWGMPSPQFALKGRKTDPGVTNVRNAASPHWRRWLGVENRCVVPFTSFSENEVLPDKSRPPVWFALDESRPLAFFAGIWTRWTSVRKLKEGETTNDLFALPDHRAEHRGRQGPPQGDAGDPDDGRRDRAVADGADEGRARASASIAGRRFADRRAGREIGCGAMSARVGLRRNLVCGHP